MNKLENVKPVQEFLMDVLPIKDLLIDRYQSPVNPLRVRHIIRNFNQEQLQPIDVSLRNNKYYIIDGQHRVEALKMLSIKEVLAKIHFYLTYEEEARLYYEMNNPKNRRTPTTAHRWNALIEAKDEKSMMIKEIVERNGFVFGVNQSKAINKIIALATLDNIYKKIGSDGLNRVLFLIKNTWDGIFEAVDQNILMGVYLFVKHYNDSFKDENFIKKLSKVTPKQIIANGKANQRYSKSAYTPYGKEILFQYNLNRPNKLENIFPD